MLYSWEVGNQTLVPRLYYKIGQGVIERCSHSEEGSTKTTNKNHSLHKTNPQTKKKKTLQVKQFSIGKYADVFATYAHL